TDLDDGVELDVAALFPRRDVDLGRGDRVEVLRLHGVGVVAGEGVPQRLIAGDVRAEPGLEEAPGGLAGTEARDLHLGGELAEGGVDRPLELRGGNRHVELDLVLGELLDRGRHRRHGECECTAALLPLRRLPDGPVRPTLRRSLRRRQESLRCPSTAASRTLRSPSPISTPASTSTGASPTWRSCTAAATTRRGTRSCG